jgi:glycosyltransferase involved in cell wall biosynthesis
MKLIIQIPCYNEADTLPVTLKNLPRIVEGFTEVEWLIIDDGSTDSTVDTAKANGADHIIQLTKHQGLARAFTRGIEECLKHGADVIINTDGDNQYNALDIPALVRPILEGKADIVIGARPINKIKHFSPLKKLLQKLGSTFVRIISNTDVKDAPSGFRAFSRDAAINLNVFNPYTYTLETIIQAKQKNMTIVSVPVMVNEDLRPSRLVNSLFSYIKRSFITIVRIFIIYRPFRFFITIGLSLFLAGFLIGLRFLYYYFTFSPSGHVQSLILASVLLGIGFQTILIAFIADLLAVNRRILEDIQYRLRKIDYGKKE